MNKISDGCKQWSMWVVFFMLACTFFVVSVEVEAAEKTITISGKIESVTFEPFRPMKGSLEIKTFWGKHHTVYVGIKTKYKPQKTPLVGDKVKIECVKVKGKLAAKIVRFKD